MSEDLHDIDDLFRDGIEGHVEAVPPSVWEGVSHDLDKKQAALYKQKYKRLKRAALVLLLLCFLGGSYIVYKESSGSGKTSFRETASKTSAESSNKSSEEKAGLSSIKNSANETKVGTRANGRNEDATSQKQPDGTTAPATVSTSPSVSDPMENTKKNPKENKQNLKEKTTSLGIDDKNELAVKKPVVGSSEKTKPVANKPTVNPEGFDNAPLNTRSPKAVNRKSTEDRITSKNTIINSSNKKTVTKQLPAVQQTKIAANQRADNIPAVESLNRNQALATREYAAPFINIKALAINSQSILPPTQPKAKNPGESGLFSLSAFAAPNISFDRLEDNDRLAGPGRNRQEAKRLEDDGYAFSAGLLLNYSFSNGLGLQSGVTVTTSSTTIAPKTVYAKMDGSGRTRYEFQCSSGFAYLSPKSGAQPAVGDSAKTIGATSKLTYVSIPLALNYRINAGRFSFYPSLGAGFNFLASGKATTSLAVPAGSESSTTAISGLKRSYVDGHIGFGIEYGIGKKLSLSLRPNARLALTPINSETPVKAYQNFLSLESGVRIKL